MKVERISIKNYKGILDQELEFNDKLNVFIGSNGAGKTTMLEAIVLNLYNFAINFTGTANSNFPLLILEDVNYEKNFARIFLELTFSDFTDLPIPTIQIIGNKSEDEIEFQNTVNNINGKILNENGFKLYENNVSIPILKYYPSNRGALTYNDGKLTLFGNAKFESWTNLIHETVSYSRFFAWFLENETKELRMQRDAEDFSIENPEIKYVRQAVEKALEILEEKQYKLRSGEIKRKGTNALIPILTLHENGKVNRSENLNNKSDGEKAIITLIADIAYNLSIATVEKEKDNCLNGSGIVLIDEIEAHLHPKWQREIIPLLTKLFPNIQFFITTHSPQVISSVSSDNIFVGEDFKFSKINIKSKGLDSNTLLKYVFNTTTRPKRYVELLEQFDKVIDEKGSIEKLEEIKELIADLDLDDQNNDVSQLLTELDLSIEAYKFESENEVN